MISRRTIFSLLLTLLLAAGIRLWAANTRDDCDRQGKGSPATPTTVLVDSGTRSIVVPCTYWIPRQSPRIQALLLFNAVLALVFLLSAADDWSRTRSRRRARQF